MKLMREITGKRLDDINREVLARLIRTSVDYMRKTYPVDYHWGNASKPRATSRQLYLTIRSTYRFLPRKITPVSYA